MKTRARQLGIKDFPYVEWDKNGGWTYLEYDRGYWYKQKSNSMGNRTYYENSGGCKTYTIR